MLTNSLASRDVAYQLHSYTNLRAHEEQGPLVITRGEGVYVFDDDGKRYLEGMAGLWCASLGFDEQRLVEAAIRQMRRLPFYHGFTGKSHDPSIELAERLVRLAPVPMSKAFLANSGSEANDTAVKMVWYYNNAVGRPEKKKIISRQKGYHGVTVAAASLTGLPANHRAFDLPIARILHTSCPHHYRFARADESEEAFATRCAEELDALILAEGPETVAAFIAEPVMGAGGVLVPPATYFAKIQEVLRRHDVLMIADEVICGFGRTGNRWGSETFDIAPDIITMAKALSAAYMPISAVLISEKIYEAVKRQSDEIGTFGHGFTYSGHPVAAAVAVETLDIYEERDIVGHVRTVGPHLQQRLRALGGHPLVGEVSGIGLIAAVEMVRDKTSKESLDPKLATGPRLVRFAQDRGVILRAMGDRVAFSPPLVISEREIDEMVSGFAGALDDTLGWLHEKGVAVSAS
ncbi:aspartate aminotransferase family protein [Arenibaculum sp.]|jgi:4-aminobutyrate--pyruvate transaminase|uniref:aspartate aminotransferase family protein n=1 Tax=Arenibaculum sp. TaxID=2865862 RepID=UPI002E10AE80|nr:aspartate aminotransferase family protein [Arenibaculum sp.]